MNRLKIKNLKKSFGSASVIDNISFEVSEGEFCILLGPSGCGKTTILRLIAGFLQQDEGEILISDKEVSNLTPKERDISMVFQSYALYPHFNIFENIAFPLKIQKRPKVEVDKKVRETARLLGIENLLNRKPKELSGGQRQRVAIGRAIVRNPKLFLFDEPLSNLDAKLRSNMRIELAKLHKELNSTMIYVTHDQIEAMTLGQKIIIIDYGVIQQIGTPKEVYDNPVNLFVAKFIGSPQINLIEGEITVDKGNITYKTNNIIIKDGLREELRKYDGHTITMGIRPESLILGEGPIRGVIEFIEHLGHETLVYVRINEIKITARMPSNFNKEIGMQLSLIPGDKGIYFFCDGKRIA